MNSSHIQGFNIETFEPWSLLIVYGQPDQFFVESKTLNKCYSDPYFALREMYYEGLLTEAQHRDAVIALMEDFEKQKEGA